MTSTRYYMARLAQAFGYYRKTQRMGDAASEMHLLREAETQLGLGLWQKVESIEELSVEYWNLRKFIKQKEEVRRKLDECMSRLGQAHEERAILINGTPEIHQDLMDERTGLLEELEKLAVRRDEIVNEAREVRRSYDGLKMKLEVLTRESIGTTENLQALEEVKTRLGSLKARFSDLKQQRIDIGNRIEEGDARVDEVESRLNEKRSARKADASVAFQVIGEGNKEISVLRSEDSMLETQMRQLYAEIGRYVSRNYLSNPACAAAAASHKGLVNVMQALRRSIALNHLLAGTA